MLVHLYTGTRALPKNLMGQTCRPKIHYFIWQPLNSMYRVKLTLYIATSMGMARSLLESLHNHMYTHKNTLHALDRVHTFQEFPYAEVELSD